MNKEELINYFKDKRKDFPILNRKVNGKKLVYVDNSATSQKPQKVINKITDFYTSYCSNVHRGIHSLSEEATEKYEEVRTKVQKFINANNEKEIVFTKGTTESINLVGFGIAHLIEKGDEVVITEMEHHANLVVWQEVCKQREAKLKVIPINGDFRLDLEKAKELINEKTKLIAITHFSNVLGTINPVKEIVELAKKVNAITVIDGAQSIPHMKIDVQDLDCDFFSFSSHKMCGPSGVGVLYGKLDMLKKVRPQQFGGSMIYEVEFEKSTYNKVPFCFEAGTPNIEGVIGFGATIDYLNKVGMDNIEAYEEILVEYFLNKIKEIKNFELFGSRNKKNRGGVFSFNLKGIHSHDMSHILDNFGIAIRGGHHCAMPLMKVINTCATSRISFYFYNTLEEIDYIVDVLKKSKDEYEKGEFLLK